MLNPKFKTMLEALNYLPPPTLHYQSDKAKSPAELPHLSFDQ